jgi:hypothetical protein
LGTYFNTYSNTPSAKSKIVVADNKFAEDNKFEALLLVVEEYTKFELVEQSIVVVVDNEHPHLRHIHM